jgi:hypothetical protein
MFPVDLRFCPIDVTLNLAFGFEAVTFDQGSDSQQNECKDGKQKQGT